MQDVVKRGNSGSSGRSRKRNMSLYYGTVAFIVLVIFAILSVTVFFNVENIIVNGSSIYTAEEIVAASGIEGGDNMIRRNMGNVEKQITDSLVYIETAKVTRRFPSSLEIEVAPSKETACMDNNGEGCWIVSQSGKVLTFSETADEDLPFYLGAEPAEGMMEGAQFASADEDKTEVIYELMEHSSSDFGSKVTEYDVTDRLNITCIYEDRINVVLGVIANLDYKYRLAEEILSTKIAPDAEGRLRLLDRSAQFLSNTDLEQIEETYNFNMETSVSTETEIADPNAGTDVSETETETSDTTKLNFE